MELQIWICNFQVQIWTFTYKYGITNQNVEVQMQKWSYKPKNEILEIQMWNQQFQINNPILNLKSKDGIPNPNMEMGALDMGSGPLKKLLDC